VLEKLDKLKVRFVEVEEVDGFGFGFSVALLVLEDDTGWVVT